MSRVIRFIERRDIGLAIPKARGRITAFTLLELLAAVAVFAILLVCVTQMLNLGQQASSKAFLRIETEQEARFVLDRMAEDLNRAVIRSDVDFQISRLAGNDALALYAEIPTYGAGRRLGLVTYRVRPEGIQRGLGDPGEAGMAFLPRTLLNHSGSTVPPDAVLDDALHDPLSANVLRAEFIAIDQSGNALPAAAAWNPATVSGLLGVLVVVDKASRELMTDSQVQAVADQFPDLPTQANTKFADISAPWTTAILSSGFQALDLPGRVKQNIRVYQRFFPLKS